MSYRILADGHTVSNGTRVTGLNNNDLIIGPSGASKTRGYVLPNILQASESMIITDTKHTLYGQTGGYLRRLGYKVMELDLTDCQSSAWGYNPLAHVRYDPVADKYNEQDIMTVAVILTPVESRDEFWDLAARHYIEALIGYTLQCLPEDEHTLTTVTRLL